MITTKNINYYNLNGELKLKYFLSKPDVENLKKEYANYINNNVKSFRVGPDYNFLRNKGLPSSLHRLQSKKKTFFYKVANKKKILKVAENLMQKKIRLQSIQFFIKNSSENYSTPEHQDNAYWSLREGGKGLSIWIALNPTGKKNGTMYYMQGSQNANYPHKSSSNTPGSSLVVKKLKKKFKKKFYNLDIGDAVVHDCKTIHGSFPNKTKVDRMAFIISYVTKDSQVNEKKLKRYERNLINISKKYN